MNEKQKEEFKKRLIKRILEEPDILDEIKEALECEEYEEYEEDQ